MTFTIRQTAARYGVGQHTVLSWIASGDLLAINVGRSIGGKKPRWRITMEAISAFEQLRSARPIEPTPRRRRSHAASVVEFY